MHRLTYYNDAGGVVFSWLGGSEELEAYKKFLLWILKCLPSDLIIEWIGELP